MADRSTWRNLIGSQQAGFRAWKMMDIWHKPNASGHSAGPDIQSFSVRIDV